MVINTDMFNGFVHFLLKQTSHRVTKRQNNFKGNDENKVRLLLRFWCIKRNGCEELETRASPWDNRWFLLFHQIPFRTVKQKHHFSGMQQQTWKVRNVVFIAPTHVKCAPSEPSFQANQYKSSNTENKPNKSDTVHVSAAAVHQY